MPEKVERNHCFDLFKGIACIFVVLMHCEFPGYLGVFVQSISRFSVPFFFMISGYYCFHNGGRTTDYRKKLKHIALIVVGATILYVIVTPIYQPKFSISLQSIVKWLFFNVPPYIAPQLWFLFALLYDYILFALLEKYKLRKLSYKAIPVGIVAYLLLAQGAHLAGLSVPNLVYRNFLILGFTFFSLGFWIHEHQDEIQVSNSVLIAAILITTLLCPLERFLMGRDFGVNIVSFPQVIAMFVLCVKNPGTGKGSLLSKLGQNLSMFVYIIHPAVMNLLQLLYRRQSYDENITALYLLPVLCIILTILISIIFYLLIKTIRERASTQ